MHGQIYCEYKPFGVSISRHKGAVIFSALGKTYLQALNLFLLLEKFLEEENVEYKIRTAKRFMYFKKDFINQYSYSENTFNKLLKMIEEDNQNSGVFNIDINTSDSGEPIWSL